MDTNQVLIELSKIKITDNNSKEKFLILLRAILFNIDIKSVEISNKIIESINKISILEVPKGDKKIMNESMFSNMLNAANDVL